MSKTSQGKSSSGFAFSEGDWTCPGCSNINFARRLECNRCGQQKQAGVKKVKKGGVQIGKAAAEKSRGLFSADDWICKTCGNVNWARRSDCNMCNSPKVGIQEERTGLGGGFNERGTVEYNSRQESDDEFDQYGRKKRKKSQNGAPKWEERREETPIESEEEESGDEDLSKYDLDDDDDEDGAAKYDLASSDEDSRSRSRSSSSSRSSSRSRSPQRKRRYSSGSSSDGRRKSSSHKKHRSRSGSRSASSGR